MTKPMIRIHDTLTDEIIDKEMTNAEFAQYKLEQEKRVLEKQEAEAKATARQAVLDRLGLTADEAKLLLGGN